MKIQAVLFLAVSASGVKLPPMIVFEGAHGAKQHGDQTSQRTAKTILGYTQTNQVEWTPALFIAGSKNGS